MSGRRGSVVFCTSEEEGERGFSGRVRKIGERGELGGGETEAGERVVCVYKARCTNYSPFPKNHSLLLRCCIRGGAWTWLTGHACRMHVPAGHCMRLVCY